MEKGKEKAYIQIFILDRSSRFPACDKLEKERAANQASQIPNQKFL